MNSKRTNIEDVERERCAEVDAVILLIVSVIAFAVLFLHVAN